jgi:hypothetical protein
MREIPREDLLAVIGCEIAKRPAAPTLTDLEPLLLRVTRVEGAVIAEFAPGSIDTIETFADAERHCCSGLGWTVTSSPARTTLTITADARALDAIEQMLGLAHIDSHQ